VARSADRIGDRGGHRIPHQRIGPDVGRLPDDRLDDHDAARCSPAARTVSAQATSAVERAATEGASGSG